MPDSKSNRKPPIPRQVRPNAGPFQAGDPAAKEAGKKGAEAAQEARALKRMLGLKELAEGHDYRPYMRLAREMRDAHGAELASSVGGGRLSPGVGSVLSTAALTLAASRWLFDLAAEKQSPLLFTRAASLADKSRMALVSAHDLAGKEASAREASKRGRTADPLSEFRAQPSAAPALPAEGESVDSVEDDEQGADDGDEAEGSSEG